MSRTSARIDTTPGTAINTPSLAPTPTATATPTQPAWTLRPATPQDSPEVAAAVTELLLELGASPPPAREMQAATRTLLEDQQAGIVLVAERQPDTDSKVDRNGSPDPNPDASPEPKQLIGVLAASVQSAIHIPGPYALIQDLWVAKSWRSQAIGQALIEELATRMQQRGLTRIEVGLPKESFPALQATEGFYRRNGFAPLGRRMRRVLP